MALKYSRESIATDVIISAVRTKEFELLAAKKNDVDSEGLFSKGKFKNNQKEAKQHQEDRNKGKIHCNICHKEDHLKKDCYFNKKNKNWKNRKSKQFEASVGENSVTYTDVLAATEQCAQSNQVQGKQD